MNDAQDRVDALEQRVLAAHRLYLTSLLQAEYVERNVRDGIEPFSEVDLKTVESDLGRHRTVLRDLLDALGYLPRGMNARPAVNDASS